MTSWRDELASNRGGILLPDGTWVPVKTPVLKVYDGDIWCDPKSELEEPLYEQGLARFMESVVAAGCCGRSGSQRFNFVHQHVTERALGDLFDWDMIFVDRENLPSRPEDEVTICGAFGTAPRRTMTRLKGRVDDPRTTLLQDRNLWRICYLSLARKCFVARIGYPGFCERHVS